MWLIKHKKFENDAFQYKFYWCFYLRILSSNFIGSKIHSMLCKGQKASHVSGILRSNKKRKRVLRLTSELWVIEITEYVFWLWWVWPWLCGRIWTNQIFSNIVFDGEYFFLFMRMNKNSFWDIRWCNMFCNSHTIYDEAKLEPCIDFRKYFLMFSNFHVHVYGQKIINYRVIIFPSALFRALLTQPQSTPPPPPPPAFSAWAIRKHLLLKWMEFLQD